MLGCALHAAASSSSFVPPPASAVAARPSPRAAAARLQEPPFPLPYSVPPLQKPYSDYVWDDSYPGTLKPGTLKENIDLDEAFEMWEGRENANMMELPQDELWQVPMPPPEDILSWLNRIGLLQETPDEDEDRVYTEEMIAALEREAREKAARNAARRAAEARSIHWFPYDRVGVVNAVS